MNRHARHGSQEQQVGMLVIAAVIVTSGPNLPLVGYLLYPFTILTTWFHEMGHGLTALLLGQGFDHLAIFADGSGIAQSNSDGDPSALASGLVAAGGPLGPSFAGAGLILSTRHYRYWRPTLYGLAAAIIASVAIWVRSPVGLAMLPLVAAAMALVAWKAQDGLVRFALQFLGVLAALSMFQDWDYLFSSSAVIDGQVMLSDTGAMQQALWLPYWLWAALLIAAAAVLVGWSLKRALAEEGGPGRWH